MLRRDGNFERVLGARREVAAREPDNRQAAEDLIQLQSAIMKTFQEMNTTLAERRHFSFSQEGRCSMRRFLARFDAIFSLNQDLLLELHYDGMHLESNGRWGGYDFPCIKIPHDWRIPRMTKDRLGLELSVTDTWIPVSDQVQPIYKLHGSVNWRSSEGNGILVIGTGKEEMIAGSRLLRRYSGMFRECLHRGGTEILVAGYGFADAYINELLLEGARKHSLRMYLINISGTASFDAHGGLSASGTNELFEIPLAGGCDRPLREVFSDSDNPAFRSIERFLGVGRDLMI